MSSQGSISNPIAATIAARKAPVHSIAILGSHPETVVQAPFDDEGWLIYCCSPHNIEQRTLPRWDAWFEIHVPALHPTRQYGYLRGLEDQARQRQASGQNPIVWMRDEAMISHYPGGCRYPDEEMRGKKRIHKDGRVDFKPGRFHRSQFRSSIAFMMAKAIADCEEFGLKQIGLWGILQASDAEFREQRPSTQYFLEEAARRGIKTLVSAKSGLFHDDPEVF